MSTQSPPFNRTLEIANEMVAYLEACSKRDTYSGHDKMLLRQFGLLLYLVNRPRTAVWIIDDMTCILPAMNADLAVLMERIAAKGK